MGRLVRYAIAWVLLCLLLAVATSLAQTCGQRKVMNLLIVNGTNSKDGYWPWHVAIFHKNDSIPGYQCGGTILDHNTVLTAAHCLMSSNDIIALERLVLQVGRSRLYVFSNRVQEHEAYELFVHDKYNPNHLDHDIALIKLATEITYTDYIQPICLWNRGEDQYGMFGTWGKVIGYGIDETGKISDTLREASVPVVAHINCIEGNRAAFALQLTSNMLCAGNLDGINACNGDSGGGLFFVYNDVWFIRGVVSFTKPLESTNICDANEYSVFMDVAKYLKWIQEHMRGTVGQPDLQTSGSNNDSHKIGLLPTSTCGVNPYARIKDTSESVLLGYPWAGVLEYTEIGSHEIKVVCHATLISDLYLITVAQCFSHIPTQSSLSVRLGEHYRNTMMDCMLVDGQMVCPSPVQRLGVESTTIHPDFNKPLNANDIALIRLRDRANTSRSNVKPICLPVTNELRSQKPTHFIQIGWDSNAKLFNGSVRGSIESTLCHQQINSEWFGLYTISEHQICMKQQNDTDVKFPSSAHVQLVQQVQGKSHYVLYGEMSFKLYANNLPRLDIFTNIASYVDWIQENMKE